MKLLLKITSKIINNGGQQKRIHIIEIDVQRNVLIKAIYTSLQKERKILFVTCGRNLSYL